MARLKFDNTYVVFQEIPDQISLSISITGCPFRCRGCHSPELREDLGEELNEDTLDTLIAKNKGISCVLFLGGDANPQQIKVLSRYIKDKYPDLLTGWYSGSNKLPPDSILYELDYIKIGEYIDSLGGLRDINTNQKLYKVKHVGPRGAFLLENITNRLNERKS